MINIQMTTTLLLLSILMTTHSLAQPTIEQESDFSYMDFNNHILESNHGVNLKMEMPKHFHKLPPINYSATYHGHPFNISMAAFIRGNAILAVHAEKVTDNSGFLNYNYLAPGELNGVPFFVLEKCAQLTVEDVESATDLNYYKQNGYNFAPTIYMKQYFKTSPNGNSEIVVTYGEKVKDCTSNSVTTSFKAEFNNRMEELVNLKQI